MELRNRWLHPEPFIPYGTEAKARDYFALASLAPQVGLELGKQPQHVEEAIAPRAPLAFSLKTLAHPAALSSAN
jgi:hypothetical protein